MSNSIIRKALLASTVFTGFVSAAPAYAQAAATPVEAEPDLPETAPSADAGEIVVTGSRIARPNLEQSSPVSVISEEEISFAQPVNAEDFLRELPGSTPGQNTTVNNGNTGISTLNLRNLGTNRNLVLLNERRVTPGDLFAQADLNIIPVALLERVDIFTGGASTVYGADAVAGVVNFITRRDFAGLDISANYGITERGDGATYRVDLTTGANFDGGRGNVALNVSYANTERVLVGNRDIGVVARASATGAPLGSPTANPATIQTPLFFDPVTGLSLGDSRVDPQTGQFVVGASDYNFNPINLFQAPFQRYGIFAQARYEVSDAVEVYTQAFYTRTQVKTEQAPSGSFFTPFFVPLNNQFLTPVMRQQICQGVVDINPAVTGRQAPTAAQCEPLIAAGQEVSLSIGRRFTEAGPRLLRLRTHTFEIVAGARGALTSTLNWDISAQVGRADRTNRSIGSGLAARLQESLRNCPTGSFTGCVPINLFGGPGSITPAQFAAIDTPLFSFFETGLDTAQAVVNGDLGFASPLADEPIGIAVGVEYRKYTGASIGDLPSRTSGAVLGAGAPSLPVSGSYDSKEVFGELVIPLIENRPLFHNLTLELGGRYSDYSTSGGNETYKIGGSYMPIPDIKFRGIYARAVRAPNLQELFQPQVTQLAGRSTDPCQGTAPLSNPTLRALCIATGAPPESIGAIPAPAAGQINTTTGGNPDLDPEIATTITAGVVLQPRFIPGFAMTLDYYDIKVKDAISNPSQADVIDACFAQTDPTFPSCLAIKRNPVNGSLSGPNNTTPGPFLAQSNLGRFRSSGFDLTASYRRDLGFGRLNLSFNGNKVTRTRFQATPVSINRECTGYFSPGCGLPVPEYSWNMRTTLSVGESDISLLWRHLSSTQFEPVAPNPQRPVGQPTTSGPATVFEPYRVVPAYNYFDFSFQQSIADNMRFTLTVQNLLDKDPPLVGGQAGGQGATSSAFNTFPSVYDSIGRRYTVGVNLRF